MTIIFALIGIIICVVGIVGCIYLFYLNYTWGRDMKKLVYNASEEELEQLKEVFKYIP